MLLPGVNPALPLKFRLGALLHEDLCIRVLLIHQSQQIPFNLGEFLRRQHIDGFPDERPAAFAEAFNTDSAFDELRAAAPPDEEIFGVIKADVSRPDMDARQMDMALVMAARDLDLLRPSNAGRRWRAHRSPPSGCTSRTSGRRQHGLFWRCSFKMPLI
jgi:hypothetical protein